MDQIKNKKAFSDLLLYQQHEGEPEEPAGEVVIQGFERKGKGRKNWLKYMGIVSYS